MIVLLPTGPSSYDLTQVQPGISNVRGAVAFGASYDADEMAVNRSTELYINLADNQRLDDHGFGAHGAAISSSYSVCVASDIENEIILSFIVHSTGRLGDQGDGGG